MKQYLYTMRDNLAHKIGSISVFESDDEAERALRMVIAQGKDPMLVRCAKDFSLISIGSIDTSTGQILDHNMRLVCDVIEILPKEAE